MYVVDTVCSWGVVNEDVLCLHVCASAGNQRGGGHWLSLAEVAMAKMKYVSCKRGLDRLGIYRDLIFFLVHFIPQHHCRNPEEVNFS